MSTTHDAGRLEFAWRKRIYEALNPEAKHGGDHKSQERRAKNQVADSATCSFVIDTARKTGASTRTVEVDVQIGEHLADDVMRAVKESP